jgi:NitT/TauT family transport system substrate-binding protein
LAQPGNEGLAIRFLRASFQGWIYCRDNPADCIQYTLKAGPVLGAGHQAWMLNEVNPLIWPSPGGLGIMDPGLWQHTVDVSVGAGIIGAAPPADAYRTDLASAALRDLADADPTGESFVKGTVEVTPGGN